METITNFINKNWRVIFTFIGLIVVIFIIYKVAEGVRIENEIASIDSQLSTMTNTTSGRLSADDYVKLLAKKKALLGSL